MTPFTAPLIRGLTVCAIGAVLTLGHIAFAAAAPATSVNVESGPAKDVETTSAIAGSPALAENCYIDVQVVRTVRGKTLVTHVPECD